jgi:hypothetical protein
MKTKDYQIGQFVKAESRHAFGPVSLEKSKTVIGIITNVRKAGMGNSVPQFKIGDYWFFGS